MDGLFSEYVERFENIEWIKTHLKKKSIEQMKSFYYECLSYDLVESAMETLRMMCKLAEGEDDTSMVIDLLNEEIFRHKSSYQIEKYFKRIIKPKLCNSIGQANLLFHLYGWLYGGAERTISQLVNELSDDFNIYLVVFSPVKNNTYVLEETVKFMEIQEDHRKIERLYKLITLLQPEVYIGNNNSILESLVIYDWLEDKKIKTIAYNHEYFFYLHQNEHICDRSLEKNYYLGKADVAVFLTSFSANAYSLLNDNGATIPNSVSLNADQSFETADNKKNILAVGRFVDLIKRVDLLLEMFTEVLKREPEAELTIVGPYDMGLWLPEKHCTVENWLDKLHLTSQNVHFVGNQTNMDSWYKNSDVLVMTSNNEGFPMVLVEAGSYGLPCVIFDIPGLEDIIIDGENGYIVPRNIKSMAGKVTALLQDNQLRKRMSISAKNQVQKFSQENVGNLWRNLINKLLHENNKESLNMYLKSHFIQNPIDWEKFSMLVIKEYEKNLSNILKQDKYKM